MERYANTSGNSGVTAYETGTESITVRFIDGHTYVYTNASAGASIISKMKKLAQAGAGLSTFISTTVKGRYEKKYNH